MEIGLWNTDAKVDMESTLLTRVRILVNSISKYSGGNEFKEIDCFDGTVIYVYLCRLFGFQKNDIMDSLRWCTHNFELVALFGEKLKKYFFGIWSFFFYRLRQNIIGKYPGSTSK